VHNILPRKIQSKSQTRILNFVSWVSAEHEFPGQEKKDARMRNTRETSGLYESFTPLLATNGKLSTNINLKVFNFNTLYYS
jgi:hypothetical protein